jgi:rRNA maturation endonuclease Nob1
MEEKICKECESEFRVEEIESEYEVQFCPYCGESLDEQDDE